jgi:glycosyltransferase involved in cell wall biosynthesis
MPRVSVITPVYNGAQFIADTIRSVAAQKNGGVGRALNHGFRAARGELFAWVSADDGYLPTYLEKAVDYLDSHPDAVCVDAAVYFVDVEGNILAAHHTRERPTVRPNDLLRANPIHGSSVMFYRHIYETLCGFNEDLLGTQDTDMWIRMTALGRIGHLTDLVTYCTRHPNQDSRKRAYIVTENQKWLANATVKRLGVEALIPSDWTGPREGPAVEAAGWFALARAQAGTSDNSLVPEWVERARNLDPSNPSYRLSGAVLPKIGALKFKIRSRIAPIAVKVKAGQARKSGHNVQRMINDWLREHPNEMVQAK